MSFNSVINYVSEPISTIKNPRGKDSPRGFYKQEDIARESWIIPGSHHFSQLLPPRRSPGDLGNRLPMLHLRR